MFGEFKDAFRKYNNGLAQLIIINVIVFIFLAVNYVFVQELFGLPALATLIHNQFSIPPTFGEFVYRPWTLLTYAFAHSLTDILHIIMNMLMLYWFGRIFVEYLGSDKLISLYILGALTGAFFYLLMFNTVPYFIERASVIAGMVGASAAVYAIVVGTATLLPDYTLFLLFFGPVKIKYIAAISIMISFIGTVGMNAGGNIAHLGGALIGFIYIKQLQSGNNLGTWITVTIDWFRDLFKPRMKVKVTYRNQETSTRSAKATKGSSVSQEELDAILDKISAGGYESLSKDEKEKLFNASKKK